VTDLWQRDRACKLQPGEGLTDAAIARRIQSDLQEQAISNDASTVVLVEGLSDYYALETLAIRCGRNLGNEGVAIVPMGGASNIRRFLTLFGPAGRNVKLAGMCDEREADLFRRSLEQAGLGCISNPDHLERLGFFVCVHDLEDELIRSLGVARIEEVIESEGELASFRQMQKSAFHRVRTHEQQLHRFFGTRSGRKYRYACLLARVLDLTAIPTPLERVLAYI